MTIKPKKIVLSGLVVIMGLLTSLNFVTPIAELIPATRTSQSPSLPIIIDLITIRSIIGVVDRKPEPELVLLGTLDSLVNTSITPKIRNPFNIYKNQITSAKKKIVPRKQKISLKPKITRPKITLEGIVWDAHSPYAILDGNIHQIGDQIGHYTIHVISDTMVTLVYKNDIYNVHFNEED